MSRLPLNNKHSLTPLAAALRGINFGTHSNVRSGLHLSVLYPLNTGIKQLKLNHAQHEDPMRKDIDDSYLNKCGKLLIKKKLSIAFAESATAGRICAEFAMVPDAGKFLKGGIVCYDADLKCSLLGVPKQQLKKFTPESETVTRLITIGTQKLIPADIHIGCTGLTAPGGSETKEKPVGTIFLYSMKANNVLLNERIIFSGSPEEIVAQTVKWLAYRIHQSLKTLV